MIPVRASYRQYVFTKRSGRPAVYTLIRRLLLTALILACAAPSIASDRLTGFEATYTVRYGPLRGKMLLRLSPYREGYVYETSLQPAGFASLFRRGVIYETSYLEVKNGAVRPIDYTRTDTIADPPRVARYYFDPDRVGGIYKSREIGFPMRAGGQNRISVHAALILALQTGQDISSFPIFDRSRWKDYDFEVIPGRKSKTDAGTIDTVEVRFASPGDDKGTSIFFAPSLAYLPVLIEYFESGDVKSRARIETYRLESEGDPSP